MRTAIEATGLLVRRICVCSAAIALALATIEAHAQGPVSKWYLTAGDQGHNFIIQGNSAVQSNQAAGDEYGIAVGNTVKTLGNGNTTSLQGAVYDLAFVDTGGRINYPAAAGAGLYDGTTNGLFNYSVNFLSGNVDQFDTNWQNPVSLFSVGSSRLGITWDPTNSSLWVSQFGGSTVTDYSLAGTVLGSFSALVPEVSSLALDSADNTLWMGSQLTEGTFYQYSKTGTLLQSVTYASLVGQNTLGGEFAFTPAVTATPEFGSFFALAGLLSAGGAGIWIKRRRRTIATE